jgi:hypothetical protein
MDPIYTSVSDEYIARIRRSIKYVRRQLVQTPVIVKSKRIAGRLRKRR